jgi:8-oxo-dGTP diphosphatase
MITVVAAIIVRNEKVLIGRRKKGSSMAQKWEFPGGKLEPGETHEICLKRELYEELGIEAEIGGFYSSGTFMPGSPGGIELLAYEASYNPADSIMLNDHEEIRWVKPSELAEYDFPEADKPIVLKLMGGDRNGN